jgi:hypothetical protein
MSSPAKDDADKQLIRALPWVSDPQRQDEARRLEEDVLAAAQRLKRGSGGLSSQAGAQLSQPRTGLGLRLSEAGSSEEKRKLDEVAARVLAALKPELMPSSLRTEMRRPGLGLVTGLIGAVGVAAAVALVVASVVRIPINAAVSSEEDAGRNGTVSTAALGKLARIEAAQASVQPAEAPSAPTGPMLAATQTNAAEPAKPAAAAPVITLSVAPVLPEAKPLAPAAAPEPRPAISLSRDEIASLLKRGQDLIAAGDIASARLVLTHVADAGDAEASFILAGTFDAAVLANLRVVGVQPDPAKAHAWYARAAEQGSLEAKQRLQQSALR